MHGGDMLICIKAIVDALAANGDTPLHMAMKLSDENQCLIITKHLVEASCSPCGLDADDRPPLHIAVVRGLVSVVEYLLSKHVPLPSRILFAALQATPLKRVEMIRLLISRGANVYVLNPAGDTLLHVAVRSLDRSLCLEIAEILIDSGCNPSVYNLRGETPFHIAARQGYHDVAIYLLLFGPSSGFLSLLHPEASTEVATLRSLIGNTDGLRLTLEDEERMSEAIRQFLDDEDECLELAKCFIGAAGNLFARCSGNATLFDIAVAQGFTRVVEYLVSVAVPLPSKVLFTALRHRLGVVPFLIAKRADLNGQEDNGDTLLHVAISTLQRAKCCETVMFLVEAGSPISSVNHAGVQPIQIAISRGFNSVVEYLLSRPFPDEAPLPPSLVHDALRHPYSSGMLQLLLAHEINVSCAAPNGDHPLHIVLKLSKQNECLALTQVLVGAGSSFVASDAAGKMPLHIAITRGLSSVVDYLLSRDVPLPSDILSYTLHSQFTGHNYWWRPVLTSLIKKGANLHTRDASGNTLIHDAMGLTTEYLCLEAIKILVDAGCNPSIPNSEGEVPIRYAVSGGRATVVDYLLSRTHSFPPDILLTALEGRNAFHEEVLKMVSSLVRNGADVCVFAPNGDTTLHIALACEKQWFKYFGGDKCLLDVVKVLVQAGCDLDARDTRGCTPFEVAMAMGYLDVAMYLNPLPPPMPGCLDPYTL